MGTITEPTSENTIGVEDMSLDDQNETQLYEQVNVIRNSGDALRESDHLEELINNADSRIDELVHFFFGSKGEQHVSASTPTTVFNLN